MASHGCSDAQTNDIPEELRIVEPEPTWLDRAILGPCVEPNAVETAQFAHVLETFDVFDSYSGWPTIGAVKFLAQKRFRRTGAESSEICTPPAPAGLAEKVVRQGYFQRQHLFHDEVGLARFLGPAKSEIVDAVARTAFYGQRIEGDDPLQRDIRPLAFTVLAEFGVAAAPYGERAFAAMGSSTPTETGAAQVAVASRYPGALAKVAQLMTAELRTAGPVVPWLKRERLFELSYALAFGGVEARQHLAPIFQLLDRKVEYNATMFGMEPVDPVPMCLILQRIGGPEAEARIKRPPCDKEVWAFRD